MGETPQQPATPDLRAATLEGVRWIGAARAIAEAVAFGSSIVLARLIPPAEFGHAVVALFVVAIAAVPGQGLATAVVQRRSLTEAHAQAAAFLTLAIGIVLVIVFATIPPLLVPVFGHRTAYLLPYAGLAFFFVGFEAVPGALVSRDLDFRRLGATEAVSVICGTVTSLALALVGVNAEAVVVGAVAYVAALAVLMFVQRPVLPRWNRAAAREIASFGVPAAFASVLYTVFRSVDYAILAARLPAAAVGYYWRAYQTAVEYQTKVSQIMLRVGFPVYSRAENVERMARLRGRIVRTHAALLFPFLTTLVAVAPQLVKLLYGARWHPAVVPMQILAVAGLATVVATGAAPLMLAANRPRRLFAFNACVLVGYVVVVTWFSTYGITKVCVAVMVYHIIIVILQFLLLERVVGISLREIGIGLLPAAVGSAVSLAVAWPLAHALAGAHASDAVVVVAASAAAALTYLLCLRFAFIDAWRDLVLIGASLGLRRRARA
jgi:PST family polysaccharide transporter